MGPVTAQGNHFFEEVRDAEVDLCCSGSAAGLRAGTQLKHLAEQHKRRDDGGRLEIDIHG